MSRISKLKAECDVIRRDMAHAGPVEHARLFNRLRELRAEIDQIHGACGRHWNVRGAGYVFHADRVVAKFASHADAVLVCDLVNRSDAGTVNADEVRQVISSLVGAATGSAMLPDHDVFALRQRLFDLIGIGEGGR